MNVIVIDYDPFAMESRVYLMRDEQRDYCVVHSDLNSLASEVIGLAYANNIYEVKTRAPFAVSAELRRQIKEQETTLYSNNKITVEGI